MFSFQISANVLLVRDRLTIWVIAGRRIGEITLSMYPSIPSDVNVLLGFIRFKAILTLFWDTGLNLNFGGNFPVFLSQSLTFLTGISAGVFRHCALTSSGLL